MEETKSSPEKKTTSEDAEHILVCLSPSQSNEKIIRQAARMAKALCGTFTALFVETPEFSSMSGEVKGALRENIALAEQLGAKIETTYGSDIAYQISKYARLSGITKIVIGRSVSKRRRLFGKIAVSEKVLEYLPELDIFIISDAEPAKKKLTRNHSIRRHILSDCVKTVLGIAAATGVGYIFEIFGVSMQNIITVYILGVLVISLLTTNRWFCLISSFLSVLAFNFFFSEPVFAFTAYDPSFPITFIVMFIAAFIMSNLAVKFKKNAKQSALTAYRTRILFDTDKLLQKAESQNDAIAAAAKQLVKLLNSSVIFYGEKNGEFSEPMIFKAKGREVPEEIFSPEEKDAAKQAFRNALKPNEFSGVKSKTKCLYIAVRANESVFGVFGIVLGKNPPDSFEKSVMLSIIGELTLALDNLRNRKEREAAALLAQNEQLRANLLRSISHDLRTPLMSISGNAGFLMEESNGIDGEMRAVIAKSIYDDSLWLINIFENLLAVTRVESGPTELRRHSELMEEVIAEAVSRIRKTSVRKIIVNESDEFLILKIDARLIVQVIVNLLDNAIKYSPADTEITLSVFRKGDKVITEVADLGNGIAEKDKARIFEMFYTAETKIADSRRSMGLGLAVCKSIITAHGGEISVRENKPKGTVFSFTLPVEEVTIHE